MGSKISRPTAQNDARQSFSDDIFAEVQAETANRFKLVIMGDLCTGKTCLAERFVRNRFSASEPPTIGASFLTKSVVLDDATEVRFNIWDTAGERRFRAMAPLYYHDAAAAIVVYDITNPGSFAGAKIWVQLLLQRRESSQNLVIALVGNKSDLSIMDRKVDFIDAAMYAEENAILQFETSAKSGDNVNELFEECARRVTAAAF